MREIRAALERFLTTPHSVDEAAFLVEIPRHDLLHQLVGVAALLSGGTGQSRFLLGREMYIHGFQIKAKARARHGWPKQWRAENLFSFRWTYPGPNA